MHTYESKWNNLDNVIIFRHINNLIPFSTFSNDIQIKTDFYPSYLNWIAANIDPLRANYLDLDINIKNNSILKQCVIKETIIIFELLKYFIKIQTNLERMKENKFLEI